jgi:hypothetical protein
VASAAPLPQQMLARSGGHLPTRGDWAYEGLTGIGHTKSSGTDSWTPSTEGRLRIRSGWGMTKLIPDQTSSLG